MQNPQPPLWARRLMRWLLKEEYLEEIEGDMDELFDDYLGQHSYRQARRMYAWETLKLLRPVLLRNLKSIYSPTPAAMYRNYFLIAMRGLRKQPAQSFINLFGLAIAIGVCILVYGFARWTYGTDQFHTHKEKVYLVTFRANREGSMLQYGLTPRPLGERLRKDFAQVKQMCRVEDRKAIVRVGDQVFHEQIRCTDPSFLQMFTFPLKWGTPRSLKDLNSIILSEKMAVKYFGQANPLGKTLQLTFGSQNRKAFTVAGVAREFPKSRTFEFDFLIHFDNLRVIEPAYDTDDWNAFVQATWIQVDHPADLQAMLRPMETYRKLQNAAAPVDWAIASFAFEPLATLHERSATIRDDMSADFSESNYKAVIFLAIIGAFMLALACLNYINIAIVSAAKRLKEIGVRKTMGATRTVVVVQFLYENLLTTFFALLLGIVLGTVVFIPGFEYNSSFDMDFKLTDPLLWVYLPIVLLVTALVSGLYPALYISRFQVIGILKGSVRFGRKNPLTRVFLGVQLTLACILVTSAVMFTQNSAYLSKRSWGYQPQGALYAAVPDQVAFEKLKALLVRNPNVVSVAGSVHHLGKTHTKAVVHLPGQVFETEQLAVDALYFSTLGLQLAQGRVFEEHHETDRNTVVVNELFVKSLSLKHPIGQRIRLGNMSYQIIGVVKDFHSYDFFRKLKPTLFSVAPAGGYQYLSLKVRPGAEKETYQALQTYWTRLYPDVPFEGGYQEDVWGSYYEEIDSHAAFWQVVACVAILLASLGLYGLIKLNVAGRIREFSIRKVLGAGIQNLADALSRQYVWLLLPVLVVATPLSYTLMELLFESAYEYHMPITYVGVGIAVGILLAVVIATIGIQVVKVVRINPVQGLKTE